MILIAIMKVLISLQPIHKMKRALIRTSAIMGIKDHYSILSTIHTTLLCLKDINIVNNIIRIPSHKSTGLHG